MAAIGQKRAGYSSSPKRGSPIKPGLRGARNWATAQVRAASYTKQGFWRLVISVSTLLVALVLGSLWLGGFLPDARKVGADFTQSRLESLGFVVKNIDVVGEGHIREEDVRTALAAAPGDFLFSVDVKAAQSRIHSLNWVDRAVVRRLWPNSIVVQIMERRAAAIWQYQGQLVLVDKEGQPIKGANPLAFAELPLVVGENAALNMHDIRSTLSEYPDIAARAEALVQMPTGRWDIVMNDGRMTVKLPPDNVSAALTHLTGLQRTQQILDRTIAVIDMRLPDRLTLVPGQAEPV